MGVSRERVAKEICLATEKWKPSRDWWLKRDGWLNRTCAMLTRHARSQILYIKTNKWATKTAVNSMTVPVSSDKMEPEGNR